MGKHMIEGAIAEARALMAIPWRATRLMKAAYRGYSAWGNEVNWSTRVSTGETASAPNELRTFFDARTEGRGIWKWNHYFEMYERHLSRFRGEEVRLLEIGIYSGGSLEMWKHYFGPKSQIYGVDIEQSCMAYEGDSVKVFIGDQKDRDFWKCFKREVDALDIVIDDGGHQTEQQIVSLEELLTHLRPGGVYICEDVHGSFNQFTAYVAGMVGDLNAMKGESFERNEPGANRRYKECATTSFQSAIHSIHLYPFATVFERNDKLITELVDSRHCTLWEPFLGW